MKRDYNIQVNKEHYHRNYDSITRFVSYFYQIDLIKKLNPHHILEIWVWNKTVSNYLKENGMKIDTCDFDKNLNPDYVADIRNLPFKDQTYDVVVAYEIIEHIPREEVDKALSELHRVSNKYVIVSIPYASAWFEFIIKIPLLDRIIKNNFINIFFRIPYFFWKIKFNGEHYWEMWRKWYPISKIRTILKKYFNIINEVRPIMNHLHYFFILEKK